MKGAMLGSALLLLAGACATKQDVEEIKQKQQEIVNRIAELKADLAKAAARTPAAPAAQVDPNRVYTIPIGKSHVRGAKEAPVTITMFSDFQCPFCAQAQPLVEQVLKEYPEKVNFVMKQFPLTQIHPAAEPAALAALAAGRQGKFWEMHDELYKNNRSLNDATFKEIAQRLGLDVARFEKDMGDPALKQQIQEEMELGRTVNVRGTPTFFVNGKLLQNRSVDGFKQMIEEALKKG